MEQIVTDAGTRTAAQFEVLRTKERIWGNDLYGLAFMDVGGDFADGVIDDDAAGSEAMFSPHSMNRRSSSSRKLAEQFPCQKPVADFLPVQGEFRASLILHFWAECRRRVSPRYRGT